jgi:transposase-like protein
VVRRIVGIILADSHPALGAECIALVTGIGYEGSSMAEIAKRHGVTRAAVSKRCVDLRNELGMPPVRAMRPEVNRDRCRAARLLSLTKQ